MTIPIAQPTFERLEEGQKVSASQYNLIVDAVEQLTRYVWGSDAPPSIILRMGEMNTDAEHLDLDKTAEDVYYNADPSTGETLFEEDGVEFGAICNPTEMPLLSGSQHLFYFHAPSGRRVAFRTRPVAIALTPSGGIPARSGVTVGSATCRLYKINASDELEDTGVDVVAKNPFASAIPGSSYIEACEELWSGKVVAIAVECGA